MNLYKTKVSFLDIEALKQKANVYIFEDECVTAVEVQAIAELAGTLKDMKVDSVVSVKVDNVLIDIPEEEDTLFFLGVVSWESSERVGKFEKATVLLNASNFANALEAMKAQAKSYDNDAVVKSLIEQPFKDVFLEKDRV